MRALVAAAVMVVLLSGCAAASAGTGTTTTGTATMSRVRMGHGSAGPASGSRAGATALARQLMARQPLPPGTRQAGGQVPPQLQGDPGIPGGGFVLLTRLLTVPAKGGQVQAFLLAHRPHGARVSDSQTGLYGPPDVTWLTFDLTRPGYQVTELGFGMLPASGGTTVVKEYAFVVWYPPRSAAEHINAAGFGSVTVTANVLDPAHQQTRHLTRTFTSRAVIARLAGMLNALPAAPYYAVPCPDFDTYSVRLRPAHRGAPSMLVATLSCVADQVVVGRTVQPPLWDQGQLAALASALLGLGRLYGTVDTGPGASGSVACGVSRRAACRAAVSSFTATRRPRKPWRRRRVPQLFTSTGG